MTWRFHEETTGSQHSVDVKRSGKRERKTQKVPPRAGGEVSGYRPHLGHFFFFGISLCVHMSVCICKPESRLGIISQVPPSLSLNLELSGQAGMVGQQVLGI